MIDDDNNFKLGMAMIAAFFLLGIGAGFVIVGGVQ